MKEELKVKIEQARKLLSEIAQDEEYRTWFREEAKRRSLIAEKTDRGTCFDGCKYCLPCLITPTPDFEIAVTSSSRPSTSSYISQAAIS